MGGIRHPIQIDLKQDVHRWLQHLCIDLTAQTGKRVTMGEVTAEALYFYMRNYYTGLAVERKKKDKLDEVADLEKKKEEMQQKLDLIHEERRAKIIDRERGD